jgi:Tol biopolymer transport system component
MPPQAGSQLGPYELTAQLGAGGMGEVWRGKDTRLDRSIAVKILPGAFAEDEERRARFEREARTISSLNHPHICTLFDVGRQGDSHFLVMELLEGESLADRLLRGPLPLDQVVKLGAQVADALDAAHKQGIVHRDLKPGNVMLTKTGAKLLDFGLARSAVALGGAPATSELATEARPLTTAGTVLGTFQYMAPEQLEGVEADPRTDIFALGALLYEMATGRRAFEGKTKTSVIAAILSSQPPPISSVQPLMPPALDHVVRKCLEKDPDDRWQSAHDVASELRWIAEAGSRAGVPTTVTIRRRSRERLAWALAAVFAAAAALGFAWAVRLRQVADQTDRPLRAELVAPPDVQVASVSVGAVALSPDGQRLAFVAGALGDSDLVVRELATGETRRLAGTTDGSFPFWSPDSRWLAFFAEGRLKKVEAVGGPVQVVCDAHAGRGGTWNTDGAIVFAPDITGPLVKVPAGGGSPVALTRTAEPRVTHRNPWFLPDGRHFLFTIRDAASGSFGAVAVASLDGRDPKVLLPRGSNPQYADGFLFTVVDGNLVAQRFDAGKLALEGQAQPIAEAVDYWNPRDLANFSVSQSGLLAYRQIRLRRTQLVWLDRGGKELGTLGEPSYYAGVGQQGLHLGAQGRILAAARSDAVGANADLWTMDLLRPQMTRATFLSAPTNYLGAAVSPDGSRLAVSTASVGGSGGSTLWIQPLAGGGSRQSLLEKGSFNVFDWTPDGAALVGDSQEAETGFDIAYLSLKEPSTVVHVFSSRFDERAPALSPDGRWIAYMSNETGRSEVFVTDFPAGTRKWQLSRSGGQAPAWRGDGREVYFSSPEGAIAVAVTDRSGALEPGPPERLPFPKGTLRLDGRVFSPDGKRFLVERFDTDAFTEPIRLLRSWRRVVEK